MRNKIDYGIDLGTTNSAIARMENGVPTIKKTDFQKDTLPSCVHYNKRKDILVGDTAANVLMNDNTRALTNFEPGKTNTFIEFKRKMGSTETFESSNLGKRCNRVFSQKTPKNEHFGNQKKGENTSGEESYADHRGVAIFSKILRILVSNLQIL